MLKALSGFQPAFGGSSNAAATLIAQRFPRVMASPPTSSFGTTNNLAAGRNWPAISSNGLANIGIGLSHLLVRGTLGPVIGGSSFPDYEYVRFPFVDYGTGTKQANVHVSDFVLTGNTFSFVCKGTAANLLMKVDGDYISLSPQAVPNDGGKYYWQHTFSDARRRLLRIYSTAPFFGGFWTSATGSIEPAPIVGPLAVAMCDSFGEGTGGNAGGAASWIVRAFDMLGWNNFYINARGGSGFIQGTPDYLARWNSDCAVIKPELGIFQNSTNDLAATPTAIVNRAQQLLNAALQANPLARVVFTSGSVRSGPERAGPAAYLQRDALKAFALSRGAFFVDFLDMGLPAGTVPSVLTTAATASVNATTISIATAQVPTPNATYFAPSGQRIQVRSYSGTNPYTVTMGGPLATEIASGTVLTQCGNSLWSGSGRIGALAGWGTSDEYVIADDVHASQAGHDAMAMTFAMQLSQQIVDQDA
jgi:hypothetical protein